MFSDLSLYIFRNSLCLYSSLCRFFSVSLSFWPLSYLSLLSFVYVCLYSYLCLTVFASVSPSLSLLVSLELSVFIRRFLSVYIRMPSYSALTFLLLFRSSPSVIVLLSHSFCMHVRLVLLSRRFVSVCFHTEFAKFSSGCWSPLLSSGKNLFISD